jgi:phage baseplate assembly protein W
MTEELFGRGVGWPLRLGLSGLTETSGVRRIEDSIRIILGTQHGERVMRPQFGCNLMTLVFAPNDAATANLAKFYVEEGLRRWEPRIDLVNVSVENDNHEAQLIVTVTYRLRASNEIHTLTYPLALERRQ